MKKAFPEGTLFFISGTLDSGNAEVLLFFFVY